jgi:hypothetical protein
MLSNFFMAFFLLLSFILHIKRLCPEGHCFGNFEIDPDIYGLLF